MKQGITALVAAVLAMAASPPVWAHGEETHPNAIGVPGNAIDVTRTIEITMHDNAYSPDSLIVWQGETIRFVIRNAGEFVHEFNIGNTATHEKHREEMMTMVESGVLEADHINHHMMEHGSGGMKHDDPNAVLLEPGQSGEIVWQFPQAINLEFACNVPGHYEAGMVAQITATQ